mmetsp:Transcript_27706/g.41228  ORF Transcript_27706/g.41228 Transcript_27706/m.41228 type:complete len:227 (-) Transcript_27706:471-1151(-)
MLTPLPSQYFILCSIFPITELFPDLCLGWWTPPNMDLDTYRQRRKIRTLLLLISWFPICWTAGWLIKSDNVSLLVIGVVAAYMVRYYLLDAKIAIIEAEPRWKVNAEPTRRKTVLYDSLQRRPNEINSFNDAIEKFTGFSTKILASNFAGVALMVNLSLVEENWRAYVALSAILIGGRGIDSMRYLNSQFDAISRIILVAGYLYMIFLLNEVNELVHNGTIYWEAI